MMPRPFPYGLEGQCKEQQRCAFDVACDYHTMCAATLADAGPSTVETMSHADVLRVVILAFHSDQPINFNGKPIPDDLRRVLEEAVAFGLIGQVML